MSGTPVVSSISVVFVVIVTSATGSSWRPLFVLDTSPLLDEEVGELGSDPDKLENELDEFLRGDGL